MLLCLIKIKMAIFYPSVDYIKEFKNPTKEEREVLNFLYSNLDDNFEVFFKPSVNLATPDIAIMLKGKGLIIGMIEEDVFDNENKNKESVIKQVRDYKSDFYNLHSLLLSEMYMSNNKNWSFIRCMVFFPNNTKEEIISTIYYTKNENNVLCSKASANTDDVVLLDKYSLTKEKLNSILKHFYFIRNDEGADFFNNTIYNDLKRLLVPPIHTIKEGKIIQYSQKQKELIRSTEGIKQKIKGVAGSGKTMVLAKRSVNAHIRTGKNVLILTFNITLRNYIRNKINDVREPFGWKYFDIIHYHEFFKMIAKNHRLKFNYNDYADWDNEFFFESVKDKIKKYDTILIDEVQDYKKEWLAIIYKYFTHQDTEVVLFGDEKQNIYERNLENKEVYTGIGGAWAKLNKSYRLSSVIMTIASNFQKTFLIDKYNIDDVEEQLNLELGNNNNILEYHFFNYYFKDTKTLVDVSDIILRIIKNNNIHSSDVCILGSNIQTLGEINKIIEDKTGEKSVTIFEHTEEKLKQTKEKVKYFESRIKKFHFNMNPLLMKINTIHSFKGWETDTLFLIIELPLTIDKKTNSIKDVLDINELIYTGMTRAKTNLIVFNLGNTKYHDFFKSNFKNSFKYEGDNLVITKDDILLL